MGEELRQSHFLKLLRSKQCKKNDSTTVLHWRFYDLEKSKQNRGQIILVHTYAWKGGHALAIAVRPCDAAWKAPKP